MQDPTKPLTIKTCTSINCPERFSLCCGAGSTTSIADEGTGCFICKGCGKEFISGECTATVSSMTWQDKFKMFYDDNENGGSSRWLVSPDTVEQFIKGLDTANFYRECGVCGKEVWKHQCCEKHLRK